MQQYNVKVKEIDSVWNQICSCLLKNIYQAHWLPSVLFHQPIFCYPSVFFKFLLTQNKRQKPSSCMRVHAHTHTHTHTHTLMKHPKVIYLPWFKMPSSSCRNFCFFSKGLSVFKDFHWKSLNPAEVAPFDASSGWFSDFKHCYSFKSIKEFPGYTEVN